MTDTAQLSRFDISIIIDTQGRPQMAATGNVALPVIYSMLGLLMRDLEDKMKAPSVPLVGAKTPEFRIRHMP